jgi:hypothetical protein
MSAVTWIREPQGLGAPVHRVPDTLSRQVGVGAGVSVATSGWIPALLVLGVLGLAIYGAVKAAPPASAAVRRRLRRDEELEENAPRRRRRRRRRGNRGLHVRRRVRARGRRGRPRGNRGLHIRRRVRARARRRC